MEGLVWRAVKEGFSTLLELRLSGLYLCSGTQGPALEWENGGGEGQGSLLASEQSGLERLETWLLGWSAAQRVLGRVCVRVGGAGAGRSSRLFE